MGKTTQREFTLKMLDDALVQGYESNKIRSISLPQKQIPVANVMLLHIKNMGLASK